MSANSTTPPGQSSGTYGAYTAGQNPIDSHKWYQQGVASGPTNRYRFANVGTGNYLSASAANPFSGNLYRVYTSELNVLSPAPAQIWRYWAPTSPPS